MNSGKIHLFTSWYRMQSGTRYQELSACLLGNLSVESIDKVCLWKDSGELPLADHPKLIVREAGRQPTFSDLLAWSNGICRPGDIVLIANTDILFNHTISLVSRIGHGEVYALTRYETSGLLLGQAHPWHGWASQDAWIFRSPIREIRAPFGFGYPRNDNAFAYLCWKAGYVLHNPALSVRILHIHEVQEHRPSYRHRLARVPPPWMFVEPVEIGQSSRTKLVRKRFSVKWLLRKLYHRWRGSYA